MCFTPRSSTEHLKIILSASVPPEVKKNSEGLALKKEATFFLDFSMIDLATLTGSCVVALGEDFTGVFTNDQSWCDQLVSAASTTGEKLWQLPMCDSFNDQLKSDVADCKNVGTRWGGSITAAKFLEKFVGSTPWIHCDIAGPAFRSDSAAYREGGASGVMVRTLVQLLESMS